MINPGYDKFIWFIGVVEDINDPKMLGRVRLRQLNEYVKSENEYVGTDDIPWAILMQPTNNPATLGLGQAPVGIELGTLCVGFYLDGVKKTKPMIIGTWGVIKNNNESDHAVSRYARGVGGVYKEYLDYEPNSQYAAQYPHNKTMTTKRGHVIEIDDTPKGERIHIYHCSGSYTEMNPDGSVVAKSADRSIDISMKGKDIIAHNGDVSITAIDGEINISSDKSINIISENGVVNIVAKKIGLNA